MTRVAVFAYSEVGYQCLDALYELGADVAWVVTHRDDPTEALWFRSVADLARSHGTDVALHETLSATQALRTLRELAPDFIFSFYFRRMLPEPMLACARRGALNVHGSLLPQYRGRSPVNWAVLNGETRTGATLHYMTSRPDAGDIVDQEAVPIGMNDTAFDVSLGVAAAARRIIERSYPLLDAGTAPRRPQDLNLGSYCSGRRPEDGRIDISQPARTVHNLIRAVAPPFPGAFVDMRDDRLMLLGSRWLEGELPRLPTAPALRTQGGRLYLHCADGGRLEITRAELSGHTFDAAALDALGGSLNLQRPTLHSRAVL